MIRKQLSKSIMNTDDIDSFSYTLVAMLLVRVRLYCRKMLDIKIEQRVNIKFLVKLKKTAAESFRVLCEVYGEECLSRARVFEWHKRFCSGREDVEDDDRSGRPTTSSTTKTLKKSTKLFGKIVD